MIKLQDLIIENNQLRIKWLSDQLNKLNNTSYSNLTNQDKLNIDVFQKELDYLINLDKHRDKKIVSRISNTRDNIISAATKFAETLSPNISKSQFKMVIDDELRHAKENYGFNPDGPNVKEFSIVVAQKLWNQPIHPDSIPSVWKSLPFKTKVRVFVDGYSPLMLSQNILDKKEATEWLTQISFNRKFGDNEWERWLGNPLLWITRHINLRTYIPRSKIIAYWIVYQNKLKPGIFEEVHTIPVPGRDEPMTFSYIDILDEIWDADLTGGIKTNVRRVFERVAERVGETVIEKLKTQHTKFPSLTRKLLDGMEYLDTPAKLAYEGELMQHCVGGYAPSASKGLCYIIHVKTDDGDSTLELDKDGIVKQHRGIKNKEVPNKNIQLVNKWELFKNQNKL